MKKLLMLFTATFFLGKIIIAQTEALTIKKDLTTVNQPEYQVKNEKKRDERGIKYKIERSVLH